MNKIIFRALIILAGINLVLVLTGIVMPYLISTDKLPVVGIVFFITTIAFAVITVGVIVAKNVMEKPKKRKKCSHGRQGKSSKTL